MREIIVRERLWYIACQDGRTGNMDFDSKEEARIALSAFTSDAQRGLYVASYDREYPLTQALISPRKGG